jgi:hypothetical protein|nr:MAG TPA: GcrA cell cycle regulator [Caudoviricetes sp.]
MLMLNNNEKKKFDILEAKRLYNSGMTLSEIANIYGYKTHKSIADKFRKSGIEIRTNQNQYTSKFYCYNFENLLNIDSDFKAYLFGLFLCDGFRKYNSLRYICYDLEIALFIKNIMNINFSESKTSDIFNLSIYPGIKNKCYLFDFGEQSELLFQKIGISNSSMRNISSPDLSQIELYYTSSILKGVLDSSGTFGFPSNSDKSVYFRIISYSKCFIDCLFYSFGLLGMRNINFRIADESRLMYEINSAEPINISILLNSVCKNGVGPDFKVKKLINFFNS